ncbi:MAG: methionyl-tRNA formyltransferase, partial [Candidatus Nomurabacteria bacterium]|nr:methionyl-tRNA formyltransferase [Candidatus Nomurabacteria bacterium]
MPKPNFIFFGTPDVASKTLDILKASGYTPTLIVTSPDKPQGRKMLMTPSPVKVWAIEINIPFIQPEKTQELENIIFRRG